MLKATTTGLLELFRPQARLICEPLAAVAVKLVGSSGDEQAIKQKVTSLVAVFSVMLVSGLEVLAPAHDFEWGVVASVKVVLLLVPG